MLAGTEKKGSMIGKLQVTTGRSGNKPLKQNGLNRLSSSSRLNRLIR
jgi:hypothetical protein